MWQPSYDGVYLTDDIALVVWRKTLMCRCLKQSSFIWYVSYVDIDKLSVWMPSIMPQFTVGVYQPVYIMGQYFKSR